MEVDQQEADLIPQVKETCAFFDSMLELIPANYYFSMTAQSVNQRYWKHTKKLESSKATKHKRARSALLAGDIGTVSTAKLVQQGYEKPDSDDDEDISSDGSASDSSSDETPKKNSKRAQKGEHKLYIQPAPDIMTVEQKDELEDFLRFVPMCTLSGVDVTSENSVSKKKLLDAINAKRAARHVGQVDADGNVIVNSDDENKPSLKTKKPIKEAPEMQLSKRQLKNLKKRKRKESESLVRHYPKPAAETQEQDAAESSEEIEPAPAKKKAKKVEEDIGFGNVKVASGAVKTLYEEQFDEDGRKKQKISKKQQLEMLEAEERRRAKKGEAGEAEAEEKAWAHAEARMQGETVKDRAALLKKSIKRDEAKKKKSAKEWKERKGAEKQSQKERADKRKANVAERKQAIRDKYKR